MNTALFCTVNSGLAMKRFAGEVIKFNSLDLGSVFEHEKENKTAVFQNPAYFLSSVRGVSYSHFPEYRGYLTATVALMDEYRDLIIGAWNADTSQEAFSLLLQVPSFGNFMAYQVMAAMSYAEEVKYSDDELTIIGPGTFQGLNIMFRPDIPNPEPAWRDEENKKGFYCKYHILGYVKYEDCAEYLEWLGANFSKLYEDLGLEFNEEEILHFMPENERRFTKQDWTNLMCELSKYWKLNINFPMRVRYFK